MSPSTVANWERGAAYPKKKWGKVEQVLDISLDGEPEPQPFIPPSLLKAIADEPGLTDEERVAVIAAVDEMLARERGASGSSSQRAAPEARRPAS